jgi:hypothetical protein
MKTPLQLPLSIDEANRLLHLIATANDAERTDKLDRQAGSWIADRLLRLVEAARAEA